MTINKYMLYNISSVFVCITFPYIQKSIIPSFYIPTIYRIHADISSAGPLWGRIFWVYVGRIGFLFIGVFHGSTYPVDVATVPAGRISTTLPVVGSRRITGASRRIFGIDRDCGVSGSYTAPTLLHPPPGHTRVYTVGTDTGGGDTVPVDVAPVDTTATGRGYMVTTTLPIAVLAVLYTSVSLYTIVYTPDRVDAGTTSIAPDSVAPVSIPVDTRDTDTPESVAIEPLIVSLESIYTVPPLPYI
jgi:hypothetical protein